MGRDMWDQYLRQGGMLLKHFLRPGGARPPTWRSLQRQRGNTEGGGGGGGLHITMQYIWRSEREREREKGERGREGETEKERICQFYPPQPSMVQRTHSIKNTLCYILATRIEYVCFRSYSEVPKNSPSRKVSYRICQKKKLKHQCPSIQYQLHKATIY